MSRRIASFPLLMAAVLAAIAACGLASAQDERPQPKVIKLTLTPAAEPIPALKYELLPPYLDRREGNAAPLYMKVLLMMRTASEEDERWEKIVRWLETPPQDLSRKEVREQLELGLTYTDLLLAARRNRCDWGSALRERGEDIYNTLLPEVQGMRPLSRVIALKARLEIGEGKYDEAVRTLQIGFKLSRDVAEQPLLINGLVSVAIAMQMCEQLESLIAAPGSPNMYWAIAALPDPLWNPRAALEMEGSSLFLVYPELQDIENKEMTAQQWRELWRKFYVHSTGMMKDLEALQLLEIEDTVKRAALTSLADASLEKRYPAARKNLISAGYDEEKVEKMAKAQVVILSEVATFKQIRDDMTKWANVPYSQTIERWPQVVKQFDQRVDKDRVEKIGLAALAGALMPSIRASLEAHHRPQHRLAALQTIEAIRMYAAGHEGRLPMSLADIKEVPIPNNPYTGMPAEYALDAESSIATLTLTAPQNDQTLVYELGMGK